MIEKAIGKVKQFFQNDFQFYQKQFKVIKDIPGSNRIFERISNSNNEEQINDYLNEVRYILIFKGLEFNINKIEPWGKEGPDLEISRDGHSIIIEIMRFRKIYSGPSEFDTSMMYISNYGDIQRDVTKAIKKIYKKLFQINKGNEKSIIVIWNDDEDMEETHVKTAVNILLDNAAKNTLEIPKNLLFIIYGSKWILPGNRQQLYCFPIQNLNNPYQKWINKINSSIVSELVQRALYF